ncbi:MAG: STAS domain-containing protein [Phycisphaeraceae bacterium]|nr:STAS domain-containing protein [Phycisphaeraceae bacterium]
MPTEWSDDILLSELADEPALSEEINAVVARLNRESETAPHVVLNMRDVTYLNSSNIAQLLTLRRELRERQRSLRLCSIADSVWQLFLVTGLDKVFVFAPDPASAIASLQLEDETV